MRFTALFPLLLFVSCAPTSVDGQDGTSCSVSNLDGGALITCEDGTETFVDNGVDGINGEDGTSCSVSDVDGGAMISCDDGSQHLVTDGDDGVDGENGEDGSDGSSCSAYDVDGGVEVVCGENDPVLISDGQDGENGDAVTFQDYADLLWSKRVSVIDIRVYDSGAEFLGRCTGTKTLDGNIITASHCFPDEAAIYTYQQDNIYLGGSGSVSWHSSVDRDIVEIVDPGWSQEGLALPGLEETMDPDIAVGNMVGNVSLPLSIVYDAQATIGFVTDDDVSTSVGGGVFWNKAFMADYAAAGGSSGSPVFDSEGNWIGIHVGGFNSSLELSIALPFE